MALYMDSAQPEDARRAQQLGFIEAITTNPILVAKAGRPGLELLAEILDIFEGPVFYQVSGDTPEACIDAAWEAYQVHPGRVIIKIPVTLDNLAIVPKLSGIDVAITAVFSPAQAYLAAQAGAVYVAPYVNRITRAGGDGPATVRQMVEAVHGTKTEIVAASIKTVEETLAVLRAGAHHLTLPLDLIEAMADHTLSRQAIEEFDRLQPA